MSEILTMSEITSKFDSEWVLIANPNTKENLEIISGKVLAHSKSRDELYEQAKQLSPNYSAIIFTGKLKENTAVVL